MLIEAVSKPALSGNKSGYTCKLVHSPLNSWISFLRCMFSFSNCSFLFSTVSILDAIAMFISSIVCSMSLNLASIFLTSLQRWSGTALTMDTKQIVRKISSFILNLFKWDSHNACYGNISCLSRNFITWAICLGQTSGEEIEHLIVEEVYRDTCHSWGGKPQS